MLAYPSRYTHRVALSNERLVSLHERQVRFSVRDNANAGRKRIDRLPAEAFIGRFLLHVLPPGLKRIRHDGILASLLETVAAFVQRVVRRDITCCPRCHCGQLRVVDVIPRARCPSLSTGPPP